MKQPEGVKIEIPKGWCTDKREYIPFIQTDPKKAQEMAEQYRDYNRARQIAMNINNPKTGLRYNPKLHKSKIFDQFKGLV